MKQALPSLTRTYISAFELYVKSFIDVLPFLLLLMLARYAMGLFLPPVDTLTAAFFIRLVLDLALTSLFFSFIMYSVFQRKAAHSVSLLEAFLNGGKRSGHIFIAYVLVSMPLILTFMLLWSVDFFWQPEVWTQEIINLQRYFSVGIIGLMALITIVLATFCFIAGVFIVNKQSSVLVGIKESWAKIKSVWLDTFLLIIFFGIVTTSTNLLLDDLHFQYSSELMTLLFSSFYPCLMAVRFAQLE